MKKGLWAVLFASMLVLGACGGGNDNAQKGNGTSNTEEPATPSSDKSVDSAAAEKIYASNCASCHGQDLSGQVGPDLRTVGSELDKDQIKDIIKNGKGQMPPNLVTGQDLDIISDWLASKK